jgi:hypothetical protein
MPASPRARWFRPAYRLKLEPRKLAVTISNLSALLIRARHMLVITITILGAQYALSFAPFFNKLPITSDTSTALP